MARFNCLATLLIGKKKRSKDSPKAIDATKGNGNGNLHAKMEDIVNPYIKEVGKENYFNVSIKDLPKAIDATKGNGNENLQAMMEDLVKPSIKEVRKENHFDASIKVGTQEKSSSFGVEAVGDDNLVRAEAALEAAYEGGDEHEEILSMKRDFSDLDLQAQAADSGEFNSHDLNGSNPELNGQGAENKLERDEGITPEAMFQNGHVSDPGMGRATAFCGSPILKRSCSNIETKRSSQLLMSPIKSQSYDDLLNLSGDNGGDPLNGIHGSPKSVMTTGSADKVMLKKRSSSHVLPSRSRKLWWKLFLWSHRNLHRPCTMKPQRLVNDLGTSNQKGGYSSDTLEPIHSIDKRNKKVTEDTGNRHQTDLWPQNHWVAFSAESSSLDRVNAWVNSLDVSQSFPIEYDENEDGKERDAIAFPTSPEIGESSGRNHRPSNRCPAEEVVQANNIIQSLNSFSSVAHISSMGLKVIPAISAFSSLRSINLSGNFIVHITPGTLPKSLHTLDLSKNKITAIEGLRDLTRLRVLNLSYNRISRIGHGLSNCTLIKELYLAGNKISDIEGLHRLLKLTVLDLSFNKITTAKALGQLVANYNSLLALNLLGNPIQSNIGDDQLRKAVTGLLPQLAYLNKQPIKPQRAREVANDSVARAALGNGSGWSSRRRLTKRMSQGSGSSVKGRDGGGHRGLGSVSGGGAGQKSSRHGTKSRHQHSSSGRK